jgi:hypothetical protein
LRKLAMVSSPNLLRVGHCLASMHDSTNQDNPLHQESKSYSSRLGHTRNSQASRAVHQQLLFCQLGSAPGCLDRLVDQGAQLMHDASCCPTSLA